MIVTGQAEKGDTHGRNADDEVARLIEGLRAAGWSEKKINDFLLFIETGKEEYKPTRE